MTNPSAPVCLITGANAGIGRATAQGLAERGAHVIMICRDLTRGQEAQEAVRAATGSDTIDLLIADLSQQSEIRTLAASIRETYPRLDVLINNAAIIPRRRETTPDGYELQWAVNHLAPFLLTHLLLHRLHETGAARIITVASNAAKSSRGDFTTAATGGHGRYRAFPTYADTKLANILFTMRLAEELADSDVTANALHPGAVATRISRNAPRLIQTIFNRFAISPEAGAETPIYLALSPEVATTSGQYFAKKAVAPLPRRARDKALRDRLWDMSLEQTGLT